MIFFFGNSSAKSTFKILAQNNSPANYCARNSSLILNHTYIGSKDAGHCPATFKPIFKAIGLKLELSGQISAGGCCVPKSAKKSPSKSESAPGTVHVCISGHVPVSQIKKVDTLEIEIKIQVIYRYRYR